MSDKRAARKKRLIEERRAQILEAATRVFARKGYRGATIREIAAAADVSEGTIYNYFASKRDLLLGLVSSASESLLPPPEEVSSFDFETLLTTFLRNRLTLIARSADVTRVLLYEARFDDDLRREYVENVLRKMATRLEERMKYLIEAGTLRPLHTSVAALAIIGSFLGFLLLERELRMELPPLDEIVTDMTNLFLDGLRARDDVQATGE
jgi:AcrR family transcriptional regulator